MSLFLTTRSRSAGKAIIEREAALFPGLAEKSHHTRVRGFPAQTGRWCQPDSPSQVDIPAGIPVALKIQIKAAQRSEEFNHVLSGRRRRRGGGMDRLFEQTGGIGLDLTALSGGLARQRQP